MKNLSYLKHLLYDDVKGYLEILDKIEISKTRIDIFNQLISLTNNKSVDELINNLFEINVLLTTLYGKDFVLSLRLESLFYSVKSLNTDNNKDVSKKIHNVFEKIQIDYLLEIDNLDYLKSIYPGKEVVKRSRKVISSLKYNQILGFDLLKFVKERLIKEELDDQELIYIMELINIHNQKISQKFGPKINNGELYNIVNLLREGFELIEKPKRIDASLDKIVNNLIHMLEESDEETIKIVLSNLNYYNEEDLEYIYVKLMIHYQNLMFESTETLRDKECYFDKDILTIIKEDYENAYKRYTIVRKIVDDLNKNLAEDLSAQNILGGVDLNNLYYSTNNQNDALKCYFMRDLASIREEALFAIGRIIEDFKQGGTSKVKNLSGQHGYLELKDDQIRIVMKKLNDNNYSVQGVFLKKSDNEPEVYKKLCNRPTALIDDNYSKEVEAKYTEYIENYGRKSSR